MENTLRKWKQGDRVTRMTVMDDGTWDRLGDKCLAKSPLRHGTVVKRAIGRNDEILVKFDDGKLQRFLDHGLQEE